MATGHLVRVVGDVRDRTDRILTECEGLVDDVVQDLAKEGQGQVVPGIPEEEPEEDLEEDLEEHPEEEPIAPIESVGSASS